MAGGLNAVEGALDKVVVVAEAGEIVGFAVPQIRVGQAICLAG